MLRLLVISALVLPSSAGAISSLPAWETAYNTEAGGKSAFEVKLLNKELEASDAPTKQERRDLWSWLSQVSAGTEKTAAQTRMQQAYTGAGGDESMLTDFTSKVMSLYNTAGTGKDDPDQAYTALYKKIVGKTLPTTTSVLALHQSYHSMSAEQQKSAALSLESGLLLQWDVDWAKFTAFSGHTKYADKTKDLVQMMTNTPALGAGKGLKCQTAYKAVLADKNERIIGLFNRKIAAALAVSVGKQ